MDENPTLSEAVFNAVSDWLAIDGEPSMLTGFVLTISGVCEDGRNFYQTAIPSGQSAPLSLGLVSAADELIREDMRTDMMLARMDEDDD